MNSAHARAEHTEQYQPATHANCASPLSDPTMLTLSTVGATSHTRRDEAARFIGRLHDVAHVAHVALERALSTEHYRGGGV
jgi:hypothetical protein